MTALMTKGDIIGPAITPANSTAIKLRIIAILSEFPTYCFKKALSIIYKHLQRGIFFQFMPHSSELQDSRYA
jgi:hypothetical protein